MDWVWVKLGVHDSPNVQVCSFEGRLPWYVNCVLFGGGWVGMLLHAALLPPSVSLPSLAAP
jgi:hypothetical protein